jgi:hypothetical protein
MNTRNDRKIIDVQRAARIGTLVALWATLVLACSAAPQDARPNRGGVIDAGSVLAVQREPDDRAGGRYDWGACVMYDGGLYRLWWVRLGGASKSRFPYATVLPDGQRFEFTYPDWGDRVYYAESRDGRTWHLDGKDYAGPVDRFGPDANRPLMVLGPAETDQERNHIGSPTVIKVAGTYYMYYEACSEFACTRQSDGRITVGNEYHNQVFVATSKDGHTWRKHPDDRRPQPIIAAPADNKRPGRQRYGLGQPSVFHRNGRFVMHYVDSCTGPGDFIIRIEADNPYFTNARRFPQTLQRVSGQPGIPAGAVARFAQTDVKYLGDRLFLVRPAYGTGNLGILVGRTGVFDADANARAPQDVYPQVRTPDPRGKDYRERCFPRFLTAADGEIRIEAGCIVIYYGAGREGKQNAYTWDIQRCDVPLRDLAPPGS